MTAIDTAVGHAAGLAAAAICAYLALGLLATVTANSSHVVGRSAAMSLRLYPPVARSLLRCVVGAVVAMSATLGATATAEAGGPHPPAPPRVAPANPPSDPLDWPAPTSAPVTPAAGPLAASAPGVTVRPGDSLWRIAARALGPRATPATTAAAWPRWWAANRSAIGGDPDLLRPGLWLRAPRTPGRSGS